MTHSAEKDAVDRAIAEDRAESWEWFMQLLDNHGYKGQPVWDEAAEMARQARAHRRNVLRRTRPIPPEVIGDPEAVGEAAVRFLDEHPLGGTARPIPPAEGADE